MLTLKINISPRVKQDLAQRDLHSTNFKGFVSMFWVTDRRRDKAQFRAKGTCLSEILVVQPHRVKYHSAGKRLGTICSSPSLVPS